MPVNFAFEFDDVYYDPSRMGLVFIHQGREVMLSKHLPYEKTMEILEVSKIKVVIDRLQRLKESMNNVSEVLDELLTRCEKGEKWESFTHIRGRLNESLEALERDTIVLLREGDELARKSA